MAMAMLEVGKLKLLSVTQLNGETHYTLQSSAGDVFPIIRPDLSKEQEQGIRAQLREILHDEEWI